MSQNFFEKMLSTGKTSILDELFNVRAEDLAEEKENASNENKERFLDTVSNVKDEGLRQSLIDQYFRDEDILGLECGRLIKKYYKNGVSDAVDLILECMLGAKRNENIN